ncbi:MAG: response regulator [Bryobacteraceae bacterium]
MPLINLLIVDDSTAIRKILQRVLRQTDIPLGEVYEAGDGIEALERLRQHPINAVLTDINMPRMDGLELLRGMRASPEHKDMPVIMITTEGAQAKVAEAATLGAVAYIRKPFTSDQIGAKLRSVLLQ